MKKAVIIIFILGLIACTSNKSVTDYKPISQDEFLKNPFGFKETIQNFSTISSPKFNTQKLLKRNQHYPEKTDTIYQFKYKNSEIFFYKTHLGKEFLLAGKVLNKQIILKNNIQIGLPIDEFKARFSDELSFNSDSLQMIGEGTKYTFIFSKGKLYRINIDNYMD
ncbi:MAG: hypothetical protein KAR57_05940 [Bacteroidales bacterium]|nr:hypothetical protein [Bacteroidales bacterium]